MFIKGEIKCHNIGTAPLQANLDIQLSVKKLEKSAILHLEMPKLRQERLYQALALLQDNFQTEAINATVANPRLNGEDEKSYVSRILDLAKQKSREAADRGTLIHDWIESFYSQEYVPDMPSYVRTVDNAITAHFGTQLWIPEQTLVNQEGYGGRCDLYCKARHDFSGVVIDFKTTQKSPGELTPYYEHTLQLAAYREVLAPTARCANVYINGDTGEVAIYEHKEQDLKDAYEAFLCLLKIYKLKNGLN
jgi:hypothetical protein